MPTQDNNVYLDYETNIAYRFYIVGYLLNGNFEQVVLSNDLIGLAKEKELRTLDPLEATKEILNTALVNNLAIVAFSTAEKKIFKRLNKDGSLNDFKEVSYINLARASSLWISHNHWKRFQNLGTYQPNNPLYQDRSLPSRMRLFPDQYHAPSGHGAGITTSRFNAVIDALSLRDQSYSDLTSTQKGKATKALKHNKWDVEVLPVLFDRILQEDPSCIDRAKSYCIED